MLFLTPNQQCQSTEGKSNKKTETLMSDDRGELLGPSDAVDSQAVVPVASEEQQLCIRRHGVQL